MPCENKKIFRKRRSQWKARGDALFKKEEERDVTRVLVSPLCKGEVVYMYILFINLLKPTDSLCFECDIFFSYLFLSLSLCSSGWSCQKAAAAATFCGGFDQKIMKKVKVVVAFSRLRRDRRHKKTFVGEISFSPSSPSTSSSPFVSVPDEDDKDKEEDKKKRSTPSLREHPFLRLFFVFRSFFFRGGEEI